MEQLRDATANGMVAAVWAELKGDDPAVYDQYGSKSFNQLNDAANQIVRLLRAHGVVAGDAVALLCSNRAEFLEVLLACRRGGYRFTPVNWHLTAEEANYVINDCEAKALFGETRFPAVEIAAKDAPQLKLRVSIGAPTPAGFLDYATELAKQDASNITDPQLGGQMLYTSGTTGRPKGVVATHGGFPTKIATDMAYCFDVEAGDRMLWVTDIGWVMGPWEILGTLTLGASMVLLEGVPDYPTPDRLWQAVERHRVTHLGVAPTVVRALREHGPEWVRKHDLTSLRVLGSSGEAWNPEPYEWFAREVGGGRCPIVNYSGGTEIGGGILGCTMLHPLKPCGFSVPILGVDADVFDDSGQPVRGAVGELVVKRPWPGMTQGFWRDPRRAVRRFSSISCSRSSICCASAILPDRAIWSS